METKDSGNRCNAKMLKGRQLARNIACVNSFLVLTLTNKSPKKTISLLKLFSSVHLPGAGGKAREQVKSGQLSK